ncbi:MAG: CDP-diacylglycerol--glycerol-3-phosphate 3-phosphatidyltransferase [Gammaproteobacteria bacterium]|jgi:CDP-diacylglycerol--glycerol-3-phosphate 3-phosphatidyltransferase
MRFNLPNSLTWVRIVVIPLVVVLFLLPNDWARPAAAFVFVFAGITDYLDGYLARRLNQISGFGAFLDPVADKLMVSTALVLLVAADPRPIMAILAAIIIGREITVSALREWMAELGERAHVAVSILGKLKTTMQIAGLSFLIYAHDLYGLPTYRIGEILLLVAAVLTIASMVDYLRAAWPALRGRDP